MVSNRQPFKSAMKRPALLYRRIGASDRQKIYHPMYRHNIPRMITHWESYTTVVTWPTWLQLFALHQLALHYLVHLPARIRTQTKLKTGSKACTLIRPTIDNTDYYNPKLRTSRWHYNYDAVSKCKVPFPRLHTVAKILLIYIRTHYSRFNRTNPLYVTATIVLHKYKVTLYMVELWQKIELFFYSCTKHIVSRLALVKTWLYSIPDGMI